MCTHHADYIDKDELEYSKETLVDWKREAERQAYVALRDFDREAPQRKATLIALGASIVLEGFWREVKAQQWTFEIHSYLLGSDIDLRGFDGSTTESTQRYIVVESQGDGRHLKGPISWRIVEGRSELVVEVAPATPRSTPYHLTDFSSEMEIEDGDIKLVKGEECAKQIITDTLSTSPGDLFFNRSFGSHTSKYYWLFRNSVSLLERMLKLEITRLLALPMENDFDEPAFSFVQRVIQVRVLDHNLHEGMLNLQLELEWGDGMPWTGHFSIYIRADQNVQDH